MINKHIFSNFVDDLLKNYSEGLDNFERGLGMRIHEGWLVDPFDKIISSLTDAFFTDEELDVNIYNDALTQEMTPEFDSEWCTINEIIYHYCFNSNFGEDTKQCTDLLKIKYKDGSEKRLSANNADELYDIIQIWHTRSDDNTYHLNTTVRV